MIPEFYEDSEIFITGGSGVVGKALIEKVLRSCNIRRIYILIRPKRNRSVQERLEKLKNEKIFSRLLREKPDAFDKIVGIPGDVLLPKLGISPENLELLKNVSVFYHSAATVRFDEPLKFALTLNVGGTHEALLLAETLKNLKCFMHVSTFYSNPYLKHVDSKLYESPMNWKFALEKLKENVDEQVLEFLCRKITTGFPNTYCFTKNLSESLVNDFRHRVPVAIYRPSIVVQAVREPEPGFPPSLMGALGLFTLAACGLLKSVYVGNDTILDMTPQDICAKLMLYYTIRATKVYNEGVPKEAPVYLVTSYGHIKICFRELSQLLQDNQLWIKYAVEKNLMIPGCIMTDSRIRYMIPVLTKEIPTALFGDLIMVLMNRKPILMSIVRKCFITLKVMEPFRFNNYTSSGITHFNELLNDTDNTDFDCREDFLKSTTAYGMLQIISDMVLKIRKYLLNESPSTIERSVRIVRVKIFIYNIIRAVMAYFFITWLYNKYIS